MIFSGKVLVTVLLLLSMLPAPFSQQRGAAVAQGTEQDAFMTSEPVVLAATGDTTDVTARIEELLAEGECHLGPGEFYVSGIDMPDNSTLYGCGESTTIKLLQSPKGYAVRMGWYNTIHSLVIDGQSDASSTVGTTHGILWQGDYSKSGNSYSHSEPREGRIYDAHIMNCSGGGITCSDTGFALFNNLTVSDCVIETCSAGINIAYWSEYHKFTSVQCRSCYYGCINNGGNNMFVNCNFSESRAIAFLMDNADNKSTNIAHGSAIGCIFNHTANNEGVGIKSINIHDGFVFDGCQIFFSQILLIDSEGIEFVNCNFGQNNCDITITNGGLTLFANDLYEGTPTITITGNQHVHFANCYNRKDGTQIQP